MVWLQNAFTRRINTRHRLWGHVFGDRYKSILVEPGNCFWTVLDYIHLNPVRAGLGELTVEQAGRVCAAGCGAAQVLGHAGGEGELEGDGEGPARLARGRQATGGGAGDGAQGGTCQRPVANDIQRHGSLPWDHLRPASAELRFARVVLSSRPGRPCPLGQSLKAGGLRSYTRDRPRVRAGRTRV
jgi:hypothetical protein